MFKFISQSIGYSFSRVTKKKIRILFTVGGRSKV